MENRTVYEVDIEIDASANNYWAYLHFTDKKGDKHERLIEREREASINSNYLQALIDAVQTLRHPCMLNVYTASEYMIAPFQNGWLANWEKHNWTSAKGKTVRNVEQWQQIRKLLAPHSARFIYRKQKR